MLSSSDDHHPLDDASDPAPKALPSYERRFRYHYNCGNTIYRHMQAKKQKRGRRRRTERSQKMASRASTPPYPSAARIADSPCYPQYAASLK
ncbi:hypothetical protein EUGRSUZ_G01056 [Eucalyptus grandis]|uniref:Uncharacterized protein n=2 Tax=Eucalyptus grandis TaxID=71139 RepID=A0ACC3K1H6_EUCGR|nr:hypothetical protein EUGRSUZ_G01056 [Eucalyptus grandis]